MTSKLTYSSSFYEVGQSLRETLDEIEKNGETAQLKHEMLYKYGRLMMMEGKFQKAYEAFCQCSTHAVDNGIQNVKELYYWTSRSLEELGNKERAINGYLMLLEKDRFIEGDEDFVNALLDRLSLFENMAALVADYRVKRYEELTNPKDFLGQTIKFLRDLKKDQGNK